MQQISERLEGSVNSVEEETQVSDLWKLNNQFLSCVQWWIRVLIWILSKCKCISFLSQMWTLVNVCMQRVCIIFPLHMMNGLIGTQLWVWEVFPAKQMTFRFPEVSSHREEFHWLKKFCIKQTWLPLQGQKRSGKRMFKKVLKYCGWWMATHWWSKHRASPTIHLKQDLRFSRESMQRALLSEGGSIQSMCYNRSSIHTCLCCCWSTTTKS